MAAKPAKKSPLEAFIDNAIDQGLKSPALAGAAVVADAVRDNMRRAAASRTPTTLQQAYEQAKAQQKRDQAKTSVLVRQAAQGAALPFMDAPSVTVDRKTRQTVPDKRFDGYSPVAVDLIPATVNAVGTMINPEFDAPYLAGASARVAKASDDLNAFLGIENPRDPQELMYNVLGGLAIPVPGPKGAGAVRAPATTLAGKAGRLGVGAAKVAAESLIPFRQSSITSPITAISAALPVAATEGIDAFAKSPEYNSIAEQTGLRDPDPVQPPLPVEAPTAVEADSEWVPVEASQADEWVPVEENSATGGEEWVPVEEEKPEPFWKDPTFVTSAIIATGLGAFGLTNVARSMVKERLRGTSALTGVRTTPSTVHWWDKYTGAAVQGDQPLRAAMQTDAPAKGRRPARKGLTPQQADALFDPVTNPALQSKIGHVVRTGEFPNSSVTMNATGAVLEGMKKLSPEEYAVLKDGLLARNAIDDLTVNGVQSSFPKTDAKDLLAMAQRLENDPKLAPFADRIVAQYRGILDYALDKGLIDNLEYNELIAKRSRYVHISRNDQNYDMGKALFGVGGDNSASSRINAFLQRSKDEASGVSTGEAADPIAELSSQIGRIVRVAEVNGVKKQFFDITSKNPAFSDVIKKLPVGQSPNSLEGVHTVWENGTQVHYKVYDPVLDAALKFSPSQGHNAFMTLMMLPKNLKQATTTGVLNPTFATISPFYDALAGMMLRNKDVDLGLINELRNRSGVNKYLPKPVQQALGGLDPTTIVSPFVGAVRQGIDETIQALGQQVSAGLMRNDWFTQAIGPQNAQALEGLLNNAYSRSVKAWMDEQGATTGGLLNHSDTNSLAPTLADIAPSFYSRNAQRAWAAAMRSDASVAEKAIATGKSLYEQTRATPLARAYLHTLKLLNEGFRYQVAATNLSKVRGDVAAERALASNVRRSAVDISQRGNGQAIQGVVDVGLYINPAIQSLAQIGRSFRRQPVTTAMNMTTTLGMLTAMTYGAAAVDPDVRNQLRDMTDDELSRQAPTFGGLVIPIDPNFRMVWGPWQAMMNEISGINSGDFNPNVAAWLDKLLEGDFDESTTESIKSAAKAGFKSAIPADVGSFPILNLGAAAAGADIGFSRFDDQGQARIVKGQQLSGLGGEGQLVDDMLDAKTMLMLNTVLSSYAIETIRAGMDADRVLGEGGTTDQALEVALSRIEDTTVKGLVPFRNTLYGGYARAQSVGDTDFVLWNKKSEAIDKATEILNKDIVNVWETGADPRYSQVRNIDVVNDDAKGTMLYPVGAISAQVRKDLYGMKRQMAELQDQTENTKNQVFSTIEERNEELNYYNDQRKALASDMLLIVRQAEDAIREATGDPSFTYQSFDPEKYRSMPYPPVPVPDPIASPVDAPQ